MGGLKTRDQKLVEHPPSTRPSPIRLRYATARPAGEGESFAVPLKNRVPGLAGVGFSNHRSVRDDGVFGDDDDAVADVAEFVVELFGFAGGRNRHVVSNARVFINDGVLDFAIGANADARFAFAFVPVHGFLRFVIVAAQTDDAVQFRARANDRAQADDAVLDARVVDDATVGNHRVINLRAVDF